MTQVADEPEQLNLIDPDKNYYVKKSNSLIESRYKLTVDEQKVINLAAAQINDQDEDIYEVNFLVRDIAHLFEKKSNSIYERLEDVSKRLMTKQFSIRSSEKDWEYFQWVTRARMKNGVLNIKISEDAKPYFLHLKDNYTRYELEQIATMTSGYGIRLYELCKQYYPLGRRRFAISEDYNPQGYMLLKHGMGCEGSSYERYSNLKQKVIIVAAEQLQKHSTDFVDFDYQELKKGKRVWAVEFHWKPKKANQYIAIENDSIYKTLINCNVQAKIARSLASDFGADHIRANIDYVINSSKKPDIENHPGLVVKAIQENYAGYKADQNKRELNVRQDSASLQKIAEDYDGIHRDFIENVIPTADTGIRRTFIKYQFASPAIQEMFDEFTRARD